MQKLIAAAIFFISLPLMAAYQTCTVVLENGDLIECNLDLTLQNTGLENHLEFGDKLHQYFYQNGKAYPVLYDRLKGGGDGHGGSGGEGIIIHFKGDGHGGSFGEGIVPVEIMKPGGGGSGGSGGEG